MLDGASATEAPITNVLALDAGNLTAKKVGIKLTDRNNTPVTLDKPFDPNVDPSITVNADGTGTFNLKAYYYTGIKTTPKLATAMRPPGLPLCRNNTARDGTTRIRGKI